MQLSVVVLNWNAGADTAACVRSVRAWEGVARPEIWVVDNGSREAEVEALARECPDVHLVRNSINRGFSGGNNLGIEDALATGTEAVLLLNNDARLDAAGLAAMLETLASDAAIGFVGPTVWHGGRCISAGGRDIALHQVTHLRPRELPATPFDVDYVPGTVVLIRREVFEFVGFLDDAYFFGGELADLCLRARRRGFRSVTDPRARATHDLERSAHDREVLHLYYIARNRFLFVRKHYRRLAPLLYARWIARGAFMAVAAAVRGRPKAARAVTLGVLDGVSGRFGGRNERILA